MGAAGGPAPSRGEGHLGVNAQGALRERTTETGWSEPKFTLFIWGTDLVLLCLIGNLVLEWWHVLVCAALVCLGGPWLNWVGLISSALTPIRYHLQALFWKEIDRLREIKLWGGGGYGRRLLGCLVGSGKGSRATRPSWLEWQLGPGSTEV